MQDHLPGVLKLGNEFPEKGLLFLAHFNVLYGYYDSSSVLVKSRHGWNSFSYFKLVALVIQIWSIQRPSMAVALLKIAASGSRSVYVCSHDSDLNLGLGELRMPIDTAGMSSTVARGEMSGMLTE